MSAFEFIIDGPPVSQFARQREGLHAWKDLVRAEAERLWPPGRLPSNAPIRMTITYYYEDSPVDTNGILKPITDALIGLIFNDNSQINELTQSRQDMHGSFRIPDFSPVLAEGFGRGREFLHVKIDGLPPLGEQGHETGPGAIQEDSVLLDQSLPEFIPPEPAPIQDFQAQRAEPSPEGITNRPIQEIGTAVEPRESPEQDVEAQEMQLESSQTPITENIAEPETPGLEPTTPQNSGAEANADLESRGGSEALDPLFEQDPALQEVSEQEKPQDSPDDIEQPSKPEEDPSNSEIEED
jgi:crossover junction endodeoxyribonuclease RusA